MKNNIECKNCHTVNPFYISICKNCNSYLQDRIYNIDLWHTLELLIESPIKGFQFIIRAEHKNFILLITLFTSVKLLIDTMLLSAYTAKNEDVFKDFYIHLLISIGAFIVLLLFFSSLFYVINKLFDLSTRIKDNYAILTYSTVPHVFGLIILFTIEMIVYGSDLFSSNPSPFVTKEALAYILSAFEILLILWSIYLSGTAMYAQSKNIIYSITAAVIFNATLYYLIYFSSVKIF